MANSFLDSFLTLFSICSHNSFEKSVTVAYVPWKIPRIQVRQMFFSISSPTTQEELCKRPMQPKIVSKKKKLIKLLQNNIVLFGQLYRNLDEDLREFIAHKYHHPYLNKQIEGVWRVDVMWVNYISPPKKIRESLQK